jgi:hypothetical protein
VVFTDERMVRAVERLYLRRPDLVIPLRSGPLPEPDCLVCSTLLRTFNAQRTGWRLAGVLLDYHDEAQYQVDTEDYLVATGIAGVHTYMRCLRIYAAARRVLQTGVRA